MKWIRTVDQSLPPIESSVITIGNFDGLHLGHQKLMSELTSLSKQYNVPSIVCTFKPHPRTLLNPKTPTHRLFDYNDQAECLEQLGIDYLIEEKFTQDFSLMKADEFMDLYIVRHFKPKHIVIGYDFSFGHNRSGNIHFLQDYCAKKSIQLTVIPAFQTDGKTVSSTAIRQFLVNGDIESAKQLLGRFYYVRGPVRVGFKRGRQIGVPTANISPDIDFSPRLGVYFSEVYLKDQVYFSITNIGYNPTFENERKYLKVETHIFDFDQEIYGEQIKVELHHFHRDEMKFDGIESLKKQIHSDIASAKLFFSAKDTNKSKEKKL